MTAGRFKSLAERIAKVKRQVALPRGSVVKGCYEIGSGGFALHRFLESIGVHGYVVAPAGTWDPLRGLTSIDEPLGADTLLDLLVRYDRGEHDVWSVLDTSSEGAESLALLSLELAELRDRRQRARDDADFVLSHLEIDGVELDGPTLTRLADLSLGEDEPDKPFLRRELRRAGERLTAFDDHIREVRKQIEATQVKLQDPTSGAYRQTPPAPPSTS